MEEFADASFERPESICEVSDCSILNRWGSDLSSSDGSDANLGDFLFDWGIGFWETGGDFIEKAQGLIGTIGGIADRYFTLGIKGAGGLLIPIIVLGALSIILTLVANRSEGRRRGVQLGIRLGVFIVIVSLVFPAASRDADDDDELAEYAFSPSWIITRGMALTDSVFTLEQEALSRVSDSDNSGLGCSRYIRAIQNEYVRASVDAGNDRAFSVPRDRLDFLWQRNILVPWGEGFVGEDWERSSCHLLELRAGVSAQERAYLSCRSNSPGSSIGDECVWKGDASPPPPSNAVFEFSNNKERISRSIILWNLCSFQSETKSWSANESGGINWGSIVALGPETLPISLERVAPNVCSSWWNFTPSTTPDGLKTPLEKDCVFPIKENDPTAKLVEFGVCSSLDLASTDGSESVRRFLSSSQPGILPGDVPEDGDFTLQARASAAGGIFWGMAVLVSGFAAFLFYGFLALLNFVATILASLIFLSLPLMLAIWVSGSLEKITSPFFRAAILISTLAIFSSAILVFLPVLITWIEFIINTSILRDVIASGIIRSVIISFILSAIGGLVGYLFFKIKRASSSASQGAGGRKGGNAVKKAAKEKALGGIKRKIQESKGEGLSEGEKKVAKTAAGVATGGLSNLATGASKGASKAKADTTIVKDALPSSAQEKLSEGKKPLGVRLRASAFNKIDPDGELRKFAKEKKEGKGKSVWWEDLDEQSEEKASEKFTAKVDKKAKKYQSKMGKGGIK